MPNEDGRRAVFLSDGDRDGSNPDGSWELFAVDLDATAAIEVSQAAPTVVRWTVEPQFALYDVIRGDLANVRILGDTVDLGPVVCLENDSRDNSTAGHEDPAEPAPGPGVLLPLPRLPGGQPTRPPRGVRAQATASASPLRAPDLDFRVTRHHGWSRRGRVVVRGGMYVMSTTPTARIPSPGRAARQTSSNGRSRRYEARNRFKPTGGVK